MTGGQSCIPEQNPENASSHCPGSEWCIHNLDNKQINKKNVISFTGMTDNEYRTEFSLWAITNSPLIVSTDVRNMTSIMKEVLLNNEIIQVNQQYMTPAGDRIQSKSCGKNTCQVCF